MNNSQNPIFSVIIPVYKCSEGLYELYQRLIKSLKELTENFEIIIINDSSPDDSWEIINKLSVSDNRVKGIKLSRNFGQHTAINAGLSFCEGDWIVVMDCDLQDKPEEIINLYNKALEGYDIVFAKRELNEDRYLKRILTNLFYWLFNFLSNIKTDNKIANFGIYNRVAIEEYSKITQSDKVFPIYMRKIGFKTITMPVKSSERLYGKTSYNWKNLFLLAFDIIISQSNKPLYISIYVGFFIAVTSFIYGLYIILKYFIFEVPIGYTSIIAAILFSSGLLLCNLGLIGIYLGKIYNEVKGQPPYSIESKTF